MPVTPTYPGVYIEEIPSGVRTITGVATSITAFLGFAASGPVNDPVSIKNFGDYERIFGGLSLDSPLSYAVQQFFLNGGGDALVVRLSNSGTKATADLGNGTILESRTAGRIGNELTVTVDYNDIESSNTELFNLTIKRTNQPDERFTNLKANDLEQKLQDSASVQLKPGSKPTGRPATVNDKAFIGGDRDPGKAAVVKLPVTKNSDGGDLSPAATLILQAISEGAWGNQLRVYVDYDTAESKPDLFNLTVQLYDKVAKQAKAQEVFRNLSSKPNSSRYIADVLKSQSTLVVVSGDVPGRPDKEPPEVSGQSKLDYFEVADEDIGQDGDFPTLDDGSFYVGSQSAKTGLYALEKADLFNLLCIPPVTRDGEVSAATWTTALQYCAARRAMLLVDPPLSWVSKDAVIKNLAEVPNDSNKKNAAVFFPRVKLPDALKENRLDTFVPSGVLAGIFARTDAARGVWKAPAGIEASLTGVREIAVKLTDGENGDLNPLGVNCLRSFPVYGNVVWGARTLDGADRLASEWKYIPVRRMALFLEESLYRGTQWVVFEPNDEPLWAQIRLNIGAFMNNLFRQGAFQGKTPREAYLVKCDRETTTQNDIDRGIVNIVVGFAPLKPAEFVIIKIQQIAGQIAT